MTARIPTVRVIATEMGGFIVACSCGLRRPQPTRYQADALAVEHQGECAGGGRKWSH